MLLLYALLVLVFVGALSSFQLRSENLASHNIRREIQKVEPVPLSGVVEPAVPAVPVVPEVPVVPVVPVVKAQKVLKVIEPVNAVQEIPRIIHQFWVGDKKRPQKLMNHCRDLHPGWEYKLWTEKNMFPLQNQKTYDCGSNNFKSDVARYELLQKYGGFYLDADTLCRRSLEPLRKKQFVAGYHNYLNPGLKGNKRYNSDLVASAVIGAPKGSAIVDQLVAGLRNDPKLCKGGAWVVVGPLYLTKTLKKMNFKDILPFHAFVPYHYIEAKKGMGKYEKMEKYDSYAANLWGTTFNSWAKMDAHAPKALAPAKPHAVVKVPCERYKRRMTSKLLKDYKEIMHAWEQTLTGMKIDYVVAYGTALGLQRHGAFIPWDDDIDLLIRAKDSKRIQSALKAPLCTHKFWGGFKVFKCNSPKAGKYNWGYPFMDVFLDTHKRNLKNSKPEIMFPSVPVVIEGIRMRAPKNLKLHIQLKFKDTKKCISPHWDHAAETGLKRVTFPCKDVMNQCYPTPPPPVLANHQGPLLALSVWDKLATEHNIPYRLEFGSLLGYVRGGAMIEHDTDVDLLIDKNSISVLEQLVDKGVFFDAGNHPPFSRKLIQAAAKEPWKEEMAVRVLVRKSHALDLGSVERRSCQNKVVSRQIDKCSFKGPLARIIYFGKTKTSFAELYMAGCEYHAPKGKYKSWTCRESTKDCSYCPSTHARAGALLEKSGGKLKRCAFSGVDTWCPASLEWSQKRVKDYYGADWYVLDKTQKHADGGKK